MFQNFESKEEIEKNITSKFIDSFFKIPYHMEALRKDNDLINFKIKIAQEYITPELKKEIEDIAQDILIIKEKLSNFQNNHLFVQLKNQTLSINDIIQSPLYEGSMLNISLKSNGNITINSIALNLFFKNKRKIDLGYGEIHSRLFYSTKTNELAEIGKDYITSLMFKYTSENKPFEKMFFLANKVINILTTLQLKGYDIKSSLNKPTHLEKLFSELKDAAQLLELTNDISLKEKIDEIEKELFKKNKKIKNKA